MEPYIPYRLAKVQAKVPHQLNLHLVNGVTLQMLTLMVVIHSLF